MANFAKRSGAQAAKAAADAASSGGRAGYFSLKENDPPAYVRPYTDFDGLRTVQVHSGVKTKAAPKDAKKWPKAMSAVCANDVVFRIADENGEPLDPPQWEDGYGSCYIHEFRQDEIGMFQRKASETRPQTTGIFVMRKPVKKVSGKFVDASEGEKFDGFADVTEEFTTEDGRTYTLPKMVYVNQSWSNFWGPLETLCYMTGTCTDRDFMIRREEGNTYLFGPGMPTPELAPGTEAWKRYDEAAALRGISVEDEIVRQSSPGWYAQWFDHRVTSEDGEGSSKGGEAPPKDDAEVSEADLAATRDRMDKVFGSNNVFETKVSS